LIDDPEPLRQQAYKDAMAKARARATQLAELSERKLGRVAAVHEVPGSTKDASSSDAPAATAALVENMFGPPKSSPAAKRSLPEFTTEVELKVEFELNP